MSIFYWLGNKNDLMFEYSSSICNYRAYSESSLYSYMLGVWDILTFKRS